MKTVFTAAAMMLTFGIAAAHGQSTREGPGEPTVVASCNATEIARVEDWARSLDDPDLRADAQILLSRANDLRADNEIARCAIVLGELMELRQYAEENRAEIAR